MLLDAAGWWQELGLNHGLNKKLNTFTGEMTAEIQRREMGLGDIALDSDEEVEDEEAGQAPKPAVVALQNAATEVQQHNATVGPRMTSGERKFVETLVEAHGLNYKKMAKDIKRNRSQETAGNIRRKVERYAKLAGVSLDSLAASIKKT
jgi:predicted DNA binding CopG/RHH family protein